MDVTVVRNTHLHHRLWQIVTSTHILKTVLFMTLGCLKHLLSYVWDYKDLQRQLWNESWLHNFEQSKQEVLVRT